MQVTNNFIVKTVMIYFLVLLCSQSVLAQTPQRSFYAVYGVLKSQRFLKIETEFKQDSLLEKLADGLSSELVLSSPIVLMLRECGQSNASFNRQSRELAICYELIEDMRQRAFKDYPFTQLIHGDAAAQRLAAQAGQLVGGAFTFVILHELGHILINEFKLPITGREEDVADQIATYKALKSDDAALKILQGGVWFFSKTDLFYTRQHFADEHSLDPQRRFNIACWAFGKDQRLFAPLAKKVGLTGEHARRCPSEYAQMARSLDQIFKATGR